MAEKINISRIGRSSLISKSTSRVYPGLHAVSVQQRKSNRISRFSIVRRSLKKGLNHRRLHLGRRTLYKERENPAQNGFNPRVDSVETVDGRLDAGVLFICDHASNTIPQCYHSLGLLPCELQRHIAYDIGAAELTRALAQAFEAPALLTKFSRLLIDPNRGLDDPTLVMRISDGNLIPGNARADEAEINHRIAHYWRPYREEISASIETLLANGPVPIVLSIHSFTPVWKNKSRPWEIGVLWDSDAGLACALIEALAAHGFQVGDNEPYDGALAGDTLDEEVTRRGLPGLLIECRQDLIETEEKRAQFAPRLIAVLREILSRTDLHAIHFVPSRTGRHRHSGGF